MATKMSRYGNYNEYLLVCNLWFWTVGHHVRCGMMTSIFTLFRAFYRSND